ncbi:MAG: group III truncated hemoglobin, partial [Stellaceae bacterium]
MTDADLMAAKRAALVAQLQQETGIDEDMIRRLVHGFYDRVRTDPQIGPVFASRITDWTPHLETMCDFWSSVLLMTGRYHGQPMRKHAPLPIGGAHFDRWLELFEVAARELCPPKAAAHFAERAQRIAESLELGIATTQGVMLKKGERLRRKELDAR